MKEQEEGCEVVSSCNLVCSVLLIFLFVSSIVSIF